MRLYIIRHAQSENNALWSLTGGSDGRSPDPLLTPTGREQARLLAEYLSRPRPSAETDHWDAADRHGFPISHLYTSLMQRAILTGTAVAQALDLPLLAWPDIHESGGIFEYDPLAESYSGLPGSGRSFFQENYPHLCLPDDLDDNGWWNRPFEERRATRARAARVAQELLARHGHGEDCVALVTHGAFTHHFLSVLLDRPYAEEEGPDPRHPWLLTNNTGITRLDYTERYATLVYTNRLAHLPPQLITD